jgi:signal transduction histidine kinase
MERFAKGDQDARVQESGAAELRDMIRRFNEMAAALSARRQAQMTFLGGVAHDLRNPLSVLRLAIASLDPERPLPMEPRLRQIIARMDRQMTRLERMVGDVLDTAKIEAGELELKVETTDVRAVVMEVVRLFEGTSEHRVEVSLPEQEVAILCDHLRVEQVVTNLIGNAIKYSPAATKIQVTVESRADEAVLCVADHGIGISEEDQQSLFEPFRRVGLSKGTVPGIGLGLFVVRRIVEAHGGRVEVESVVGMGSTFRVRLPIWSGDQLLAGE